MANLADGMIAKFLCVLDYMTSHKPGIQKHISEPFTNDRMGKSQQCLGRKQFAGVARFRRHPSQPWDRGWHLISGALLNHGQVNETLPEYIASLV